MATSAKRSATTSKIGNEALKEKTGKTWREWFDVLDSAGAKGRPHQEIVALLKDHGVGQWYGQMITVGYEQERGLRVPHQKPNGFEISVSKTLNAAVGVVFMLFEDQKMRKRWMKDTTFDIRRATSNKRILINWPDGTNVVTDFYAKGANKTQVVVQQSKIGSARAAEQQKTYWASQLDALKNAVED